MVLTENEKKHMGATIQTNKTLHYGNFDIPAGTSCVVYDYGRTSGDPFVDFGEYQCVVPWSDLTVIEVAA